MLFCKSNIWQLPTKKQSNSPTKGRKEEGASWKKNGSKQSPIINILEIGVANVLLEQKHSTHLLYLKDTHKSLLTSILGIDI